MIFPFDTDLHFLTRYNEYFEQRRGLRHYTCTLNFQIHGGKKDLHYSIDGIYKSFFLSITMVGFVSFSSFGDVMIAC